MSTEPTGIAPQQFRDLMASVCAPVTVVTAAVGGVPHGATVSSFASLSLQPPLISIALDRRSALLGHIRNQGRFAVNLLGQGQAELATVFARRDLDRFACAEWYFDHGLPRLRGTAGWLEATVHAFVDGGDHELILGHVEAAGRAEQAPLIYAHRTFGTHSHFAQRPRPLIIDQIAACAR
ncbi:flavin reductase family protein [Nocardia sp. NBC_01327]|uniref:flavin reductase family protein n=1 Tax=Nocardia sp. NBC_01327 TaxID=2903593 RepID=UPI002E0F4FF8|nr:flavin reductase family protein [Nocardia sp. NBC_01327]